MVFGKFTLAVEGGGGARKFFTVLSNSLNTGKKWTEEDEENFRDIISAIHAVAYQTAEDEEARIEWIKSLKQRLE